MVEENTIACEHVVCFTIILRDPERIQFCDAIRAARVEGCILILRHRLNEPIKLGRRCLVEPHMILEATGAYGIEQA
jgi:hypothetical protein